MNRPLLGIVAGVLLVLGLGSIFLSITTSTLAAAGGTMLRLGLVLGALWLALPALGNLNQKIPKWLLAVIGVALLIIVIRPAFLLYVLPVVGVLILLQSRMPWLSVGNITSLFKPRSRRRRS